MDEVQIRYVEAESMPFSLPSISLYRMWYCRCSFLLSGLEADLSGRVGRIKYSLGVKS